MAHRSLGAALILVALIGEPPAAYACDCSTPPVDVAIAQADIIARGPITRIEVTEITGVLRVTAFVRERVKGAPGTNLTIYSHPYGGSCLGYDFHVGREYVIFAKVNDGMVNGKRANVFQMPDVSPTAYVVYLCGGTAELGSASGNKRLTDVRQRLKPKE